MVDPESPMWTTCVAKYVSLDALDEVAGILGFEGLQGLRRYLAENVWYAREVAVVLFRVYQRRYGGRAAQMLGRAFVDFVERGRFKASYPFPKAPPCEKHAQLIKAVDVRAGPCVLLFWSGPPPAGVGLPDEELKEYLRFVAKWFRWWPPSHRPWQNFTPPQWILEVKEECGLDSVASTSRNGKYLAAWLYWHQHKKPPGLC